MTLQTWAAGESYEPYVGRWSRRVAVDFADWLAPPPGLRWLDVGCGTGALASTVIARARPARVTGVDPSLGFVRHARTQLTGVGLAVADATALPAPDRTYDHVVSGLVLNFVPEPDRAVREMRRVANTGGTVAAYVWDYAGRMQLMRYFWDAATRLDPTAAELDEGRRFSICQPDRLAALFQSAGVTNVDTRAIEVPTVFADFDDYWTPFLGGQGPAPGYAMSLPPERRDRLREELRANLPAGSDGSIALVARAWAVRGTA
ncbi:MAG: class I SAM-dependent methyltransferase [Micromonosporaceae bacterium]